ncbi:hypothetical protein ACFVS9_20210 [Streptomyces sp. NPDC058008]|uniref:hypothetical protein n=1 Tax=Streptomyces sp. NPDC058008 TaxID=3346303 RepID=UPI0036E31EC1
MGTPSPDSTGVGPAARAADLLAGAEGLRARTRAQMDGAWASLLGFGLLGLAAAPMALHAFGFGAHRRSIRSYSALAYAEWTGLCVVHEPGTPCRAGEFDGATLRFVAWGVWFALLPLAWFLFARWYRLRGESRGVVPRRGAWLRTTGITTVAITAVLLVLIFGRNQPWEAAVLENRYASPWYVVGIGLIALGVTERRWIAAAAGAAHALLLTGYFSAPWGSGWLPWQHPAHPGWSDGPQFKALLLAAVLLLAGLAEWATARRRAASGPVDTGTVAA